MSGFAGGFNAAIRIPAMARTAEAERIAMESLMCSVVLEVSFGPRGEKWIRPTINNAISMIELENEAQDNMKKSVPRTSILMRLRSTSSDRTKYAAERIASSGLRPHLSMKPILEANRTPVEER